LEGQGSKQNMAESGKTRTKDPLTVILTEEDIPGAKILLKL